MQVKTPLCDRQRAYVRKRRAWAKKVGVPFPKNDEWPEPDPGVIDAHDTENG